MTLGDGIADGEDGELARLLRDFRAAHVTAPSTDVPKAWVGRALLKPRLA